MCLVCKTNTTHNIMFMLLHKLQKKRLTSKTREAFFITYFYIRNYGIT
jgi:hypothetical protein